MKMACGDRKAAFRVALLDPELTLSQPPSVTAITGLDALTHAIESYVCAKRSPLSQTFSLAAWRYLESNYAQVLDAPLDLAARGAMQLGSYFAGMAIEASMLGAAHACANPLTAHYGITHGHAVGVMLPHVVRFNSEDRQRPYGDLGEDPEALIGRLRAFLNVAGIAPALREHGVKESSLDEMAEEASRQWTATFNPRKVGVDELRALYESAM